MEDIILYPGVEEYLYEMEETNCDEIRVHGEHKATIKVEDSREFSYQQTGKRSLHRNSVELNSDSDVKENIEMIDLDSCLMTKIQDIASSTQSLFNKDPLLSLCRLCAIPCNDMIHIFGSNVFQKVILEKIQFCLPVSVKKNDTLSKQVCCSCLEKLESCYQFFKIVTQAEKQLLLFCEQTSYKPSIEAEIHCQTPQQCDTENAITKNIDEEKFNLACDEDMITAEAEGILDLNKDTEAQNLSCDLQNPGPSIESPHSAISSSPQQIQSLFYSAPISPIRETHSKEESKCENAVSGFVTYSMPNVKRQFNRQIITRIPQTEKLLRKLSYSPKETKLIAKYNIDDNSSLHIKKEIMNAASAKQSLSYDVISCLNQELACHYCGKRFSQKSNLKRHLLMHAGIKPFGCNICAKVFSSKEYRDNHHRTHTGERPYNCEICGMTFANSSNKIKHHKIHGHDYRYSCDFCPKTYRIKSDRDQHHQTHTGERPYQCELSSAEFITKSNKVKHLKLHGV